MLGIAARAMGYRIVALDPDPDCPTSAVADEIVVGAYDDLDAARRLASMADVVDLRAGARGPRGGRRGRRGCAAPPGPGRPAGDARSPRGAPVHPGDRRVGGALARGPGRRRCPRRRGRAGYPVRLKAPIGGYDGRSQVRIPRPREVEGAARGARWRRWTPVADGGRDRLRGRAVDRVRRDRDGRTLAFPVSRNVHDAGVLAESVARRRPSTRWSRRTRGRSRTASRAASTSSGLLTVELFQLPGGGLMINELAPAGAQLRPLDDRGGRDLAVRAAPAGDPRAAAGLGAPARFGRDGEPAGHRR